jgi:hypothetical protein
MWAALPTKAAAAVMTTVQSMSTVEECSHKLQVLRTDNAQEFTTAEFAAYYADEGIQQHYALYTPQQK